MEKIKQCSTCRYWEKVYDADETSYGICNAPVPIATVNLLKEVEIPNNVLDICSMESTDGSDCNAYASLEEVDTLERVRDLLTYELNKLNDYFDQSKQCTDEETIDKRVFEVMRTFNLTPEQQ